MTFVVVAGVAKTFSGKPPVEVLRDISIEASKGEFLSIVGPSGCGKSTLLRVIGNLLPPTSGQVTVGGISAAEAKKKARFSYAFQNSVLLPWRNLRENVALPMEIVSGPTRDVSELVRLVGLEDAAARYPSELSGGMRQRTALARALVVHPDALLLDEPFGAVDELTRGELNVALHRLWQEVGVTIFLVTHNIAEAVALSDRIVVLTQRPARIRGVVSIGLPRPRFGTIQSTPTFQGYVQQVRDLLQ